eukprot:SAG11_NODE_29767_length_307_cov_1.192308_1_plen_37_part_10
MGGALAAEAESRAREGAGEPRARRCGRGEEQCGWGTG